MTEATPRAETLTNPASAHRPRRRGPVVVALALVTTVVAAVLLAGAVDGAAVRDTAAAAGDDWFGLVIALGAFGSAFLLRAIAWQRVLPSLSTGQALAAIHCSLGANHVLPLRLGESARVLSVVRRTGIGLETATASTITLRAADMMGVVVIGVLLAPVAFGRLLGPIGWVLVGIVAVVGAVGWRWLASIARRRAEVRMPGPVALGLSLAAWGLESVLVHRAAEWAGLSVSWHDALFVTAVAVAAQIAAVAPGGLGTYEAAGVAAWVVLGYDAETALVAALAAHAVKTAYSLIAGAIAVFLPAPGMLGRLRLPRHASTAGLGTGAHSIAAASSDTRTAAPPGVADGPATGAPVVLFMPAHDEAGNVGACVARVPATVAGRPVHCIVVDDGSTDATAAEAEAAGAQVVRLGTNQGLGAAVRAGFAAALDHRPAAIAFCDADGEYPPEDLADLVEPILAGRADYVVGSRFRGHIETMRPWRRLGNHVLTRALSIVARRRISDGQSGYRAFSPAAAAAAEIIHDFNYAQVLTLDLLAKGYRYSEVPIRYRFRTHGDSFIRLVPYLRRVGPAVYRELNTA